MRFVIILILILEGISFGAYLDDKEPAIDIKGLLEELALDECNRRFQAEEKILKMGKRGLSELMKFITEEKPPDKDIKKRIRDLIKKLADERYAIREDATKRLIDIGEACVGALEKEAKESQDPEVRYRARYILKRIRTLGKKVAPEEFARYNAIKLLGRMNFAQVIPFLIELLNDPDPNAQYYAYYALRRVTNQDIPFNIYLKEDKKKKSIDEWKNWWKSNKERIEKSPNLTMARKAKINLLGRNLLILEHANRVIEVDRKRKILWQYKADYKHLEGARRLENGNTLLTYRESDIVIEVDKTGKIVWKKEFDEPLDSKRLSNGNTLISEKGKNRIIEVDRSGKVIWEKKVAGVVYDVDRLSNGNTLISIMEGDGIANVPCKVIEMDKQGKVVWRMEGLEGYIAAERLSNGNTLIGTGFPNQLTSVIEVDRKGVIVWQKDGLNGPYDASRMPNGNTIIVEFYGNRVIEVDRTGKVVWEMKGLNMPWRIQK